MKKVKEAAQEVLDELPEDCTWDDLMYQLYVREKIERSLQDSAAGRTKSHEEVRRAFQQ